MNIQINNIEWYMYIVLAFIDTKVSVDSFNGVSYFVEYKMYKGNMYVLKEWQELT